jgi:hypothetical protein
MEASVAEFPFERLTTIVEDGEFVVCRGYPTTTASSSRSVVAVMPRLDQPSPRTVRMREHELALRDELDPSWAVRLVRLTTNGGRQALTSGMVVRIRHRGATPARAPPAGAAGVHRRHAGLHGAGADGLGPPSERMKRVYRCC